METVIIALIGVIGIVIGAITQYYVTKGFEHKRHLRNLRTEAYKDYAEAVADLANPSINSDRDEMLGRIANAKARICIFGTSSVVQSMADFENSGGRLDEIGKQFFSQILLNMRKDIHDIEGVNNKHITNILFLSSRIKN